MGRRTKFAIVGAGYLLAFVAAACAGYLYNVRMAAMPYDTSGGMYAAGEGLTELGVFLVVALVPTLLALWFLRHSPRLWLAIAIASLAFAGVGLIAVLLWFLNPGSPRALGPMLLSLFGLAQLLGVPLWTAAFVLFAVLAPTRPARRLLVVAVAVELVIGVFSVIRFWGASSRY